MLSISTLACRYHPANGIVCVVYIIHIWHLAESNTFRLLKKVLKSQRRPSPEILDIKYNITLDLIKTASLKALDIWPFRLSQSRACLVRSWI